MNPLPPLPETVLNTQGMEIKVKSLRFDATEKLNDFIQKKVGKLERACDEGAVAEVTLRVVKPETAMNKETVVTLSVGGSSLRAEKVADSFEEGVDSCVEVLQRQLVKHKEKQRTK